MGIYYPSTSHIPGHCRYFEAISCQPCLNNFLISTNDLSFIITTLHYLLLCSRIPSPLHHLVQEQHPHLFLHQSWFRSWRNIFHLDSSLSGGDGCRIYMCCYSWG